MKGAWRMADEGDGLAGGDEALDQPDGIRVFGEIPHRPVAAGIEDRVEIGLIDTVEANRPGELRLGGFVGIEAARQFGLEHRLVALGIERRLAALGRRERYLGAGFLEDVKGCGKLFEPEAGLLAGVAELVMRSQN